MDKKAFIKYLCALLIFGSNGVMVAHINLTSYEIVFLRTMIGTAFIIFLYLVTGNKFHIRENKRDAVFIAISGMLQGASWVLLYEGYRNIGVGVSSLIYYCGPIILVACSPLLFNEKLTRSRIICFGVVLLGLVLINGAAMTSGQGNMWGFLSSVLSALTFFLMLVFNKKSRNIVGMENAVIQVTFAFIAMAIFIGFTQQFVIHTHASDWPWIVVQGVLNTAIGCYLYYSPLSKLPVQTVAVCGYLEPLAAVVFAAIFLGETMTFVQVIGAVCIIGGAVAGELTAQQRRAN